MVDVARGAALMTGTKMNYEITMAFSDYVPNRTLGVVVDECLRELGAPDWTDADDQLALELLHSYPRTTLAGIREELAGYFAPDELVGREVTGQLLADPRERRARIAVQQLERQLIVRVRPVRRAQLTQALVHHDTERAVRDIVGKRHRDLVVHLRAGHERRAARDVDHTRCLLYTSRCV